MIAIIRNCKFLSILKKFTKKMKLQLRKNKYEIIFKVSKNSELDSTASFGT